MVMKKKCSIPECDDDLIVSRGLCRYCYIAALKLVNNNKITWEKLESAGKCIPPTTRKGKLFSKRNKWFLS